MAWMTATQLRAFDDGLANTSVYSDAQLTAVIADVEVEIERLLGQAFNSRTITNEWHLGDGGVWLPLDNAWPTTVTACTVGGVSLSAGTIANMIVDRRGSRVWLSSGWIYLQEITISYSCGQTAPPADLLRAAKLLCRARLGQTRAPIMDRAERYVPDGNGGTFILSMPGAARTGIPDVDAILARYVTPGLA